MGSRLGYLILWPDHDALCKTMPTFFFLTSFGTRVVVVVHCLEVFIYWPTFMLKLAPCHHINIKTAQKVYLGITLTESDFVCVRDMGWASK